MVIEPDPCVSREKKIVFNSRFGRFLHGFQETFPHRTRKMLTVYLKFEQNDFTFCFCFAKFVTYFCKFLMI